jgi:hypothetical protein
MTQNFYLKVTLYITNYTVPCGIMLPVKFLLDIASNILLNVVHVNGFGGYIDGILLHI